MVKLLEAKRFVDMETGCSYRYVNSKTEYFRIHTHDYYEIFIMLEGEATHYINGDEKTLFPMQAIFIRASDAHNYAPISEEPFSFLNITFTKETLDSVFSYLGEGYPKRMLMKAKSSPAVKLTSVEFEAISHEMEKIRAILPEDAKRRQTAIRVLLIKLFADVFENYVPEEKGTPEWLKALTDKMESEMNFEGGIARMVELSGKSREHLTRTMRKHLGKSPSELVNELRLNYIANMLLNSNHKILDIVLGAGFNTVSYASVLFFKRYGMSMSAFRKNDVANAGSYKGN